MVIIMRVIGTINLKLSEIRSSKGYRKIYLLNKHIIIRGYCFFISFIFLLICTKSSPIYPFNDWVDANAFFTMGKGMMNGKVPYRDLFEQKGPLLYFIYGFSYLISNKTFLGVFFFQVLSFSIFLFYCYKVFSLYLDDKYFLISLPLIASTVLNMGSFTHGGSAEEFCIPLLAMSLYYLMIYFKNDYPNPINYKYLFINGIIAGNILWIKYSLLGFWFGWMLIIFISMITVKEYSRAVASSLIFLCGMFLVTIPWIMYFGVNNAVLDWLNTYVLINIKYYSKSLTLFKRIEFLALTILLNIVRNLVFIIFCFIGMPFISKFKKYTGGNFSKTSLIVCITLLYLGIYGGGREYIYYFLIFSPFVIFGFISIFHYIKLKRNFAISNAACLIIIVSILIIILPINLLYNQNTYMLKIKKEDLVQYQFASIINQTKGATVLNYGSLDAGFYTVAGITPNVKFFHKLNLDYTKYQLNLDEQNKYIKNKSVDYVIVRQGDLDNVIGLSASNLFNNYELIREQEQVFEGKKFNYLLLRKKPI
jgi:hypothetical protein